MPYSTSTLVLANHPPSSMPAFFPPQGYGYSYGQQTGSSFLTKSSSSIISFSESGHVTSASASAPSLSFGNRTGATPPSTSSVLGTSASHSGSLHHPNSTVTIKTTVTIMRTSTFGTGTGFHPSSGFSYLNSTTMIMITGSIPLTTVISHITTVGPPLTASSSFKPTSDGVPAFSNSTSKLPQYTVPPYYPPPSSLFGSAPITPATNHSSTVVPLGTASPSFSGGNRTGTFTTSNRTTSRGLATGSGFLPSTPLPSFGTPSFSSTNYTRTGTYSALVPGSGSTGSSNSSTAFHPTASSHSVPLLTTGPIYYPPTSFATSVASSNASSSVPRPLPTGWPGYGAPPSSHQPPHQSHRPAGEGDGGGWGWGSGGWWASK